jgi:tRNA (cytidine/uridine-2'-O-)-methyltransferase
VAISIVLLEPEIPQNTGNIARSCAATGARLHLIGPLGFSISDKHLKRAGLDYWNQVDVRYHDNWQQFMRQREDGLMFYASTKGTHIYTEPEYPENCFLVFGPETRGLPESLLKENANHCIRIPMRSDIRSLNLSNSVAVILYEALRQHGFSGLDAKGSLATLPEGES